MKKLFIIVNHDWFFLSHRKNVAVAAKKEGWDVTIVTKNTGQFGEIQALGLKTLNLPINATGMNMWQEWKTFYYLLKLYCKNKDAVVHHVGLKTILWGGLAAKIVGVKGVVNAVSGLGVMFSGGKCSFVARDILQVLRYSHRRKNVYEIFQNHEDEALLYKFKVSKPETSVYIKGSGVDMNEFVYVPEPESEVLKVMFAARMVKEKGFGNLIEAAEMLREEYEGKVQFLLCGKLSDNPKAIKKEELEAMCDGHYIQWLGHRNDVRELLQQSHIVAFPSYYREGVPKSLIEAAAVGRPIITCNSIGCKDVVDDGVNGFLIKPKDSKMLAEKLKTLIEDKELRVKLGRASREKAEKEFSIEDVTRKHLKLYASMC